MMRKRPGKDSDDHEAFRTVQWIWRFTRKILGLPFVSARLPVNPPYAAVSLTALNRATGERPAPIRRRYLSCLKRVPKNGAFVNRSTADGAFFGSF